MRPWYTQNEPRSRESGLMRNWSALNSSPSLPLSASMLPALTTRALLLVVTRRRAPVVGHARSFMVAQLFHEAQEGAVCSRGNRRAYLRARRSRRSRWRRRPSARWPHGKGDGKPGGGGIGGVGSARWHVPAAGGRGGWASSRRRRRGRLVRARAAGGGCNAARPPAAQAILNSVPRRSDFKRRAPHEVQSSRLASLFADPL